MLILPCNLNYINMSYIYICTYCLPTNINMFHNLYICSCITCCLIVYNYLYYHALCGAFNEIKKVFKKKAMNLLDVICKYILMNYHSVFMLFQFQYLLYLYLFYSHALMNIINNNVTFVTCIISLC